jgi:heptosyltransferase-2
MRNILIIKTGYSETFGEKESSSICSLGDVLRTFFIINNLKDCRVDWITSEKAVELFSLCDEKVNVLTVPNDWNFDFSKYDLVINLEKDLDLLNTLSYFSNVVGFFLSNDIISFNDLDGVNKGTLDVIEDCETYCFEKRLVELLGIDEIISLPIKDSTSIKFDIGLNWKSGAKWPEKQLDNAIWKDLYEDLSKSYSVSWQEGFDDINDYISWIDSCGTIISLDSLGLHIARRLGKNIVALFGPTDDREIEFDERGRKVFYRTDNDFQNLKNTIIDNINDLV